MLNRNKILRKSVTLRNCESFECVDVSPDLTKAESTAVRFPIAETSTCKSKSDNYIQNFSWSCRTGEMTTEENIANLHLSRNSWDAVDRYNVDLT